MESTSHQVNETNQPEVVVAAICLVQELEQVTISHSYLIHLQSGVINVMSYLGKKEKGAPDMNNEESFPTLSAAVAIEQNNFKLKRCELLLLICFNDSHYCCICFFKCCVSYFTDLNRQSVALLRLNQVDHILTAT